MMPRPQPAEPRPSRPHRCGGYQWPPVARDSDNGRGLPGHKDPGRRL